MLSPDPLPYDVALPLPADPPEGHDPLAATGTFDPQATDTAVSRRHHARSPVCGGAGSHQPGAGAGHSSALVYTQPDGAVRHPGTCFSLPTNAVKGWLVILLLSDLYHHSFIMVARKSACKGYGYVLFLCAEVVNRFILHC